MASEQDWTPVILKKSVSKKTTVASKGPTNSNNINTITKSVSNKQSQSLSFKQFKTLDSNEDITKPVMFSTSLGSKIASTRANLGMDRKKLAMTLSITENELASVETGKKVFNQQLLNKINKALGTSFTKTD